MEFSNVSTNQGILQDTHFLCNTNSTSYPTADIVRNVNRWIYRGVTWLLEANPNWSFDDRNLSTHPEVLADLVAGQKDYQLPTDILKLLAVYIKKADGDYTKLRPVTEAGFAQDLDEMFPTDGLPQYYELKGGSIFLYPGPATADVTTTNGIKLSVSREIDVFTASDTTQESALAEPFERLGSYGAAYDYLIVNGPMDRAQSIRAEIEAIKNDMLLFYSGRSTEQKLKIQTAHERNRNGIIL
jgi:hypothetical protein